MATATRRLAEDVVDEKLDLECVNPPDSFDL